MAFRTALASAARTATATSSVIPNQSKNGYLIAYLNVTAASGTGGLQLQVFGVSQDLTLPFQLNATPTAVTGTGKKAYIIGPGLSGTTGDVAQVTPYFCPSQFQFKVVHGDSSSYTYSVEYDYPHTF